MPSIEATRRRAGMAIARRCIAALSVNIILAACSQTTSLTSASGVAPNRLVDAAQYQALSDEKFPVPAVEAEDLDPKYLRQRVRYVTLQTPGTIVVDPDAKYLYLVMEGGYALRYGIGVGREGFGWSGSADIARKALWPSWTPPAAMIQRDPKLEQYRKGMEPGLQNPLGARALYLYQDGRDTLYRIHGTNEPASIGQNVSSGCIRLLNQDIIDLFRRVPVASKVVVLKHGPSGAVAVPPGT